MTAHATEADPVGNLADVIQAAHFTEPLLKVTSTTTEEDQALLRSLEAHAHRVTPEDASHLTGFLSKYPHSGWAPALWTNLGLSYRHYGYFSRALDAWQKAWNEGKDATDPQAKALVDRAVGELARLYASFGRNEELAALFADIGERPITGSATEAVQSAREELALSEKDPGHLFICGPLALQSLMITEEAKPDQVAFLQWYRAGPNGTNLAGVGNLADKANFAHRLVFREASQPVPVPAVVHWKAGHFATIIGQAGGRFQIHDPVFGHQDFWMSRAAVDAEASGYFIVPARIISVVAWRDATVAEANNVWGKGPTTGTPPGTPGPQDPPANPAPPHGPPPEDNGPPPDCDPNCSCPMCFYNIGEATVSLSLSDTPVGYKPPVGPSAKVQIVYNQREDSQPAVFSFFNLSPKWTLNWLTYVTDDPANPGASVSRYIAGGGAYFYNSYQSRTGQFAAQSNDGSILVLASQSPITYRRQMGDGSVEIYAQSNGSTSFPRNVFLSQIIDPQGNALTLNYDGQQRLVSLTDATGRQTTFSYELASRPLLITKIADPFGRSAVLSYDSSFRLHSITDVIGLTSSFTYDVNSLVNSLTTPYGTTTFAYTPPGTSAPPRFLQVTDPLGNSEREEWLEPAPIPDSDPAATVPVGMPVTPTNQYLTYRNSFHWDKSAYVAAGCTPSGGCNYTKARIRHFTHVAGNANQKSTTVESVKYPLENRIWFNYPAQTAGNFSGNYVKPTVTARVLDDGTTQLSSVAYDTAGYFKVTQVTDPLGRITSYAYSNHIDLAAISQTTAFGIQQTIAQYIYNARHRPIFSTDAAGQTTAFAYNAAGQVTSATNPLGQTTSYQYNATGDLITIINANNATAASFTYDAYDRVRTYTDSEGWTATYDYDAADRITKITYPDGTTRVFTYDKLDLALYQDRQFRKWIYAHDANRRLTSITDPAGNQTLFGYTPSDQLRSLTDPKSNVTSWVYDVEDRVSQKIYPDTNATTYTYENTTSRLRSVLDALGQTKQYGYAQDNLLATITYLNAVNATPNVSFAYDPYFQRRASMTDGTGTSTYSYVSVGSLGALQLQQESGPLSNSTIAYAYDQLGRLASRTVSGAGTESYGFDALNRLTSHTSDLGAFTLSYLGQTSQITQRQLANSTLSTAWSYLPNSGDRRLAGINNIGLTAGQFSTYGYSTTSENFISAISETSDSASVYPTTLTQTASYNNLNELTNLSGQTLTFDANGNLLSDGQRNYRWDAENRLIAITYPGQTGKQTAFAFDGLSRRTAITSTPSGGSATSTSYIWCGSRICQARNASNAPTRSYYPEGEFVAGTLAYYYGSDQVGSVRRVFASATSAPAYSYAPYGSALQSTAPVTDFNYAGMFFSADSGLSLTRFRAYDSVAGRWLSRDPDGERSDTVSNLYPYVGGNPLSYRDRQGANPGILYGAEAGGIVAGPPGAVVGAIIGGLAGAAALDYIYHSSQGGGYTDTPGNKPPFAGDPGSTVRGGTGSRTYGPDGYPQTDRDTPHPNEKGIGSEDHCHDWGRPPGGGRPSDKDRGKSRSPEPGDPPLPRGPNVPPP